jgi:O-antigen/teichoic acid export membrane protein
MGISLYTSRLVLEALGVEDFGIYNIVGGIVALFTIIKGALSSCSMRFLSFEMGRGDHEALQKTFSVSFTIHCFIALIILFLLETLGLWYINTILVVPDDRLNAANWVYQFSIITSVLSLVQVPYNAVIISHERMDIYAWIGIAEVLFKLLLVFLLLNLSFEDKLILYGSLICLWSILIQLYYHIYCIKSFAESKLVLVKEKTLYKKMFSFAIWHLIGDFSFTGTLQITNMLINYYFGVVVNASCGIGYQVESAIALFSAHFMTAVKPQIVKLFAEGQNNKMLSLVFNASKYSFFLLYIISLPVLLETDFILGLWLKEVPVYTSLILRYIIIARLIVVFSHSISEACRAAGDSKWFKWYWIGSGGTNILIQVPLTYIFFKLGYPAVSAFIIRGIAFVFCNFVQLIILKNSIKFSILEYIKKVYIVGIIIAVISAIPPIVINRYFTASIMRLLIVCLLSIITIGISVFFIGINMDDRQRLKAVIKIRFSRKVK